MNKETTKKLLNFAKQFEGTKTYNEFLLFFEQIYHDILESNGMKGFEIHWSDDGECITDHVCKKEDADLIAAAPELLESCKKFMELFKDSDMRPEDECYELADIIANVINKAEGRTA